MVCALIFPSIVLLNAGFGSRIDTMYDSVYRYNNHMPESGISEDTGIVTTARFLNVIGFEENKSTFIDGCEELGIQCIIAFSKQGLRRVWSSKNRELYDRLESLRRQRRLHYVSDRTYIDAMAHFSRCKETNIIDNATSIVPSTGWKSFFYAMHHCNDADVFGVTLDPIRENYKEYDTKSGMWPGHDFYGEHKCLIETAVGWSYDAKKNMMEYKGRNIIGHDILGL